MALLHGAYGLLTVYMYIYASGAEWLLTASSVDGPLSGGCSCSSSNSDWVWLSDGWSLAPPSVAAPCMRDAHARDAEYMYNVQ